MEKPDAFLSGVLARLAAQRKARAELIASFPCGSCTMGSITMSACREVGAVDCRHGPELVQLVDHAKGCKRRAENLARAGLRAPRKSPNLWPVIWGPLEERAAVKAVRLALRSHDLRWLVLSGPNGSGKSLAALLAIAERGGLYFSAAGVARLSDYRGDMSSGDFGDGLTFRDATEIPLLVVDDLGLEALGDYGKARVEEVITAREYGALLTIITTNLNQAALAERYGSRLVSRLTGSSGMWQACKEPDARRRRGEAA